MSTLNIPSGNTWQLWANSGESPNDNLNLTGNTIQYKMCDGFFLEDANISIILTSVNRNVFFENGNTRIRDTQTIRIKSDVIVTEDLTINLDVYERSFITQGNFDSAETQIFKDVVPFNKVGTISLTIPNGFDQSNLLSRDVTFWEDFGNDHRMTNTSLLVATQENISQCDTPNCGLKITGVTSTTPSFQGDSNGSISIGISGSTGTTQYSIDGGVTYQTGNTFTGLTSGLYSLLINEGLCFDGQSFTLNEGNFRTSPFQVTEPNQYLAAENPIITNISTALYGIPTKAKSTFSFDTGIENNYRVIFNLNSPNEYSTTFSARDFPNSDSFFVTNILKNRVGVQVGSNTTNEMASSFAEALQKDIIISRLYFIDVNSSTVTLTAKEASSRLTLNTDNVTVLNQTGGTATTGITFTTLVNGSDQYEGSLVNDYSIFNDIYIGDDTIEFGDVLSAQTYNNFTTLELPFNINNQHQFNANEVIKSFVSTPKIDLRFTGFTVITDMIRPFYIKYGEKYPLVINENTAKKREKGQTGYKWAINSSIDWEEANDMTNYFTGTTGNSNTVKFLTNSPNPLDIQRNQTNFLYFLLPKNYTESLNLVGDIEFYDGSSQLEQTLIEISEAGNNVGGVYALNVSYDTLNLAAYEASGNTKIKRVTFNVQTTGGTPYTETKVYRFEIDEQPRKFGVAFENKLGAYDTFDFVGIVENSIDRTNKTYTIPKTYNVDGSVSEGFKSTAMYDTQVTKTITVNSGWIDREHFDWLIELLSSNNVYSYTEDRQNYLIINGFTYNRSSLEDLFEVEVEFTLTLFENNITT